MCCSLQKDRWKKCQCLSQQISLMETKCAANTNSNEVRFGINSSVIPVIVNAKLVVKKGTTRTRKEIQEISICQQNWCALTVWLWLIFQAPLLAEPIDRSTATQCKTRQKRGVAQMLRRDQSISTVTLVTPQRVCRRLSRNFFSHKAIKTPFKWQPIECRLLETSPVFSKVSVDHQLMFGKCKMSGRGRGHRRRSSAQEAETAEILNQISTLLTQASRL